MPEELQKRVLLADDREENRYVLKRILMQAGFACLESDCGARAIEIAQTLPDLVILDVRLPDMSGYEVCHKIKHDPRTASIPVLQISASFVASSDRARALEAGADGYLTHPIDGIVLVATVRSLLRLRAAEVLAIKSADRWQATFNSLSDGLAVVDSEGRILRCNQAFTRICGDAIVVGKNGNPFLQSLFSSMRPMQLTRNREIEHEGRTLQLSVTPVEPDSNSEEWIVALADISDRKLAEYAIRTAEKLAATGKLASAIAHEINNPLEALINLLYLAGSSDSIDAIREHLSHANHELDRIARVTKQTLSFHRDTQQPVDIDLRSLVGEVVGLFERSSSSRGVKLVYQQQAVPSICGFPGQLTQVFGNLIRNAAEAGPRGSQVIIRVRPFCRGGREGVRITIHDNGGGIPENIRTKIFDPFFTTKALKGSGLGLWVSRTMVLRHGGTIRFRSWARQGSGGTTFEIFLPVDGMEHQQAEDLNAEDAVA